MKKLKYFRDTWKMCQSTTKTIFSVHENKLKKVIIITIIMCFNIYIYPVSI